MEIGNKPVDTIKTTTAGAVMGGAIGTAAVLKPVAADSFKKSVLAQKDKIDKFKNSAYGAKNDVKGYIETCKKIQLDVLSNIEEVTTTYTSLKNSGNKAKLDGMTTRYNELVQRGAKGITKDIAEREKLLTKGKTSKLTALKEAAAETAQKTADGLKKTVKSAGECFENIKTNLKETKGKGLKNKFGAIKEAAGEFIKQNPKLIKAGKFAAIGAAIGLGAALISKAVSKKEEN